MIPLKPLSWSTHILCNILGIGYLFQSCRDELTEYTMAKINADMERLKDLQLNVLGGEVSK